MSLLRQLALGGLFVLTASSSGCICGGLALLGDHEDEPQSDIGAPGADKSGGPEPETENKFE